MELSCPNIYGRDILMLADFDADYEDVDYAEEEAFLNEIKDYISKCHVNFYYEEIKNFSELKSVLDKYDKDKIVIFNWCEELEGKPNTGQFITKYLEDNNFVFSGALTDTLELCLDREKVNKVLVDNDIPTPKQYNLNSNNIQFPVIVKSKNEHGSQGISQKSIIENYEELNKYKETLNISNFIAEQFINGEEFTLNIWGNENPEALPISKIEYNLSKQNKYNIIDYDSKWDRNNEGYKGITARVDTDIEENLEKQIKNNTLNAFKVLKCNGIARFDIRVQNGIAYIIDFNPNPVFQPNTSFTNAVKSLGGNYGYVVMKMCEFALDRVSVEKKV